jgi:hypothetical protein
LERPFLKTTKAIIYADIAKICFTVKDKKEKFSFKDHILYSCSSAACPKRQHKWPRRRRKEGERTRLASHLKRLST